MTYQGQSIKYLPFRACFGVYGSYVGLILNVLCLIAQIYLACSPVGGGRTFTSWLMDVIAVPVIFGFFIVWKVCKCKREAGWIRLAEMDLITGRKDNWVQAHAEDVKEREGWSSWQRMVKFLC